MEGTPRTFNAAACAVSDVSCPIYVMLSGARQGYGRNRIIKSGCDKARTLPDNANEWGSGSREGFNLVMRGCVTRSIQIVATLALLYGCTACKHHAPNVEPGDYLATAFADMARNAPPSPDQTTQQNIQRIILRIREKASRKKGYAIESTLLADLGYQPFPAIAPLLRNPDPWVRWSTIAVLFQLDRKRSIPFLVGMLPDIGRIQYRDDDVFVDTTIGREAAGYLAGAFQGSRVIPVPVEETGQPQAEALAQQRWYTYHLPYCSWRKGPPGELCWLDSLALYSHVPAEVLPARLKSDPEEFKYVPVVWPQVSDSSTRSFSKGQLVRLSLIYQNFGTESFPWPEHPEGTHVLRLVGPDGRDAPATPKLRDFMKQAITPPVPPGYALAWTIDLDAAYDISGVGYYRFYYNYLPPKSRRRSEFGETLELRCWNGREYANYYDFLVK